jgi:hypothetical protein
MAIVECPKCNEKIMTWHPDCPYCGKVLKRNYSKLISVLVVLGVAGGGFYAAGKVIKQNRIKEKETVQQQTKVENEIVSEIVKKIQPLLLLGIHK